MHMHIFRSLKIKHSIAFGIGAAIGVLYLMSAIAANAETLGSVSVAGNGKTIVRGAKVMHISGNEITAVTTWGAAKIQWKILVTGSSRFLPERIDEKLTDMIKVGETIGFSGQMDQKSAAPLIYASLVRNESVLQSAAILDGSVIETSTDGFVVQTETGTSSIRIGTGTIMTKDGNRVRLKDLVPGETVKAFGTLNTKSRMLSAERVVSASLPQIPNTGAPVEKSSFIDSIVAWIRLGSSALTLR